MISRSFFSATRANPKRRLTAISFPIISLFQGIIQTSFIVPGPNASPSIWFTLYDSTSQPSDYPILFFYSSGTGTSYFRVWDGYAGYVNLATPIHWDSWNTLKIDFSIAGLVYSINGVEVYTKNAALDAGSTTIANVMFQGKNYGTSCDAYWATSL